MQTKTPKSPLNLHKNPKNEEIPALQLFSRQVLGGVMFDFSLMYCALPTSSGVKEPDLCERSAELSNESSVDTPKPKSKPHRKKERRFLSTWKQTAAALDDKSDSDLLGSDVTDPTRALNSSPVRPTVSSVPAIHRHTDSLRQYYREAVEQPLIARANSPTPS